MIGLRRRMHLRAMLGLLARATHHYSGSIALVDAQTVSLPSGSWKDLYGVAVAAQVLGGSSASECPLCF